MAEELERVERVLEAMRRRGESVESDEPIDRTTFELRLRSAKRRRTLHRCLVLGVPLALAIGFGTYLVASPARDAGTAAPSVAGPATAFRPDHAPPELRRVEPFAGVVAFLEEDTKVAFDSPERILLSAGSITLQLRGTGGARDVVVATPGATVTVTGTVLSISVVPAGTEVDVLRGRVHVSIGTTTVMVDEQQCLRPGSTTTKPLPADRAARLSALFPDERPCPTVATAEPPRAPGPVVAPPPENPPPVEPGQAAGASPRSPSSPSLGPSVEELYRSAEIAMRAGRSAEAADLLRQVLDRSPVGSTREGTALIDLAQVCEQTGDAAGQRDALGKYLAHHPSGAFREDARLDLCRILQRTGPAGELRSCLEAYVEEFPDGRRAGWARDALGMTLTPDDPPHGDGG